MPENQTEKTIVVFANAASLVSAIMREVAGHEVGETIGGSIASREMFDNFFASHAARRLPQMQPDLNNH